MITPMGHINAAPIYTHVHHTRTVIHNISCYNMIYNHIIEPLHTCHQTFQYACAEFGAYMNCQSLAHTHVNMCNNMTPLSSVSDPVSHKQQNANNQLSCTNLCRYITS